ncbi:MAG TPA: TonB C-terminal domain-containing protein [Candidatus Obscuribacterales bacterium]
MRPKFHTLKIILTSALIAATPAAASPQSQSVINSDEKVPVQNANTAAGQRFELSAMYSSTPSLSRREIDPRAMMMGPEPPPAKPGQGVPTVASRVPSVNPHASSTTQIDSSNGYMNEYNVDWSRWVSVQADRWYYVLQATEDLLGLRFMTLRPAMIQYTCYADGSIRDVVLKQSSGVPAYDRLQIETLMATMPIPQFPKGTRRTSITLCQGWESHAKEPGEQDYQPGSFGHNFPKEKVSQWSAGR